MNGRESGRRTFRYFERSAYINHLRNALQTVLTKWTTKLAFAFIVCFASVMSLRQSVPVLLNNPLRSDFAQDYAGARALLDGNELYPVLGQAFARIGLVWDVGHRSTHPPSAFILALPLAYVPYPEALVVWTLAMLACMVVAGRAFGLSWFTSMAAALFALAWPPALWSLGQLTPIWLLGLALAYRFRDRPLISGACIGLASLPKFLAAPALLEHLRHRRWSALLGFGGPWTVAFLIILILRPDTFISYLAANSAGSVDQIWRADNGALFVVAWRMGGFPGALLASVLTAWVIWSGFRTQDGCSWACFSWVGIALLPIAWVYSLLPLLPWLMRVILDNRVFSRALAALALFSPVLGPVPTVRSWSVALCIILAGLALGVHATSSSGDGEGARDQSITSVPAAST